MEYLINQVAADIGVGDCGANCLNPVEKGQNLTRKVQKMGRDQDLTNFGCGCLSEGRGHACGCRPLPSSPLLITLCGPVLYCTVLYCTVLITLCGPVLCVHCDQLRSSSQVSSCEGRRRNDGTRGLHTRCQQNSRMAKHVD